jgi:DNA-binding GntR family transcriptional regulator
MHDFTDSNMNQYLPLRDVVFFSLRQAILTGDLRPGERLMEIHLAERLGVSRTPIREAIRKLELEGLVVMIPRKGAHVASITEKHLQDVLEVRRALESLGIALACERITKAELIELNLACKEFENSTKSLQLTEVAKADVAFHDVIIRASKNTRLITLMNNLSEQMYRYRFEYLKDITNYNALVQEHRNLYEALTQQNAERAVELMKVHVDNQAIYIFNHLV